MVNSEVEGEPTVTKSRIEEHGKRIRIACLLVGQPHTEECRARITARMETDPALAKRLQDNLIRRVAFSKTVYTSASR